MNCVSTSGVGDPVSFEKAVLTSVAPGGHLWVPDKTVRLPDEFWYTLDEMSRDDLFKTLAWHFLQHEMSRSALNKIVGKSLNFPVPLRQLDDRLYFAELFHGPTGAFKDFGARFLAAYLDHIASLRHTRFTILVATSGDTGGAVASAFERASHSDVFVLYPINTLSHIQEQQILGAGANVHPIPVTGTFDDCQDLVKQCLNDKGLKVEHNFVSANSINLGRLLPQLFYYIEVARQLPSLQNLRFYIPSGNLGNLSAGLWAREAGLPATSFIAAHNSNDAFHCFLQTGTFPSKPLVKTMSSAMDVSRPNNLERIFKLTGSTWNTIKNTVHTHSAPEDDVIAAMKHAHDQYNYLIDPHTAVAYGAYLNDTATNNGINIILATASPAKFPETVHNVTGTTHKKKYAIKPLKRPAPVAAHYASIRSKLLNK